jgi:hypothetical protein
MIEMLRALLGLSMCLLFLTGCVSTKDVDEPMTQVEPVQKQAGTVSEPTTQVEPVHKQAGTLSEPASKEEMVGPVSLEITPTYQNQKLVIKGRTNLPNGAKMRIGYVMGQRPTQTVPVSNREFTATFEEVSGSSDHRIWISARFDPTFNQPSQVLGIVGAKGEKLTGPLVETSNKLNKIVRYAYVDPGLGAQAAEGMPTRSAEFAPSQEIIIQDLKVEEHGKDGILVTGQTNLVHATELHVSVSAKNWLFYSEKRVSYIQPDGGFSVRMPVPSKITDATLNLTVTYTPGTNTSNDQVVALHGKKGDQMTGPLVQERTSSFRFPGSSKVTVNEFSVAEVKLTHEYLQAP